jgi:arylsulfatase A-like enzyme
VFENLAIQLDLHATALAAAGVEPKPEWKLDGVDLLPWLSGKQTGAPHDALYWRFGQQMAIRSGNWKLVRYDGTADTEGGEPAPVTPPRLYNLADDIHEKRDLAAENPEKVKELQAQWDEWNRFNVKPLFGGEHEEGPGAGKKKKKQQPPGPSPEPEDN